MHVLCIILKIYNIYILCFIVYIFRMYITKNRSMLSSPTLKNKQPFQQHGDVPLRGQNHEDMLQSCSNHVLLSLQFKAHKLSGKGRFTQIDTLQVHWHYKGSKTQKLMFVVLECFGFQSKPGYPDNSSFLASKSNCEKLNFSRSSPGVSGCSFEQILWSSPSSVLQHGLGFVADAQLQVDETAGSSIDSDQPSWETSHNILTPQFYN